MSAAMCPVVVGAASVTSAVTAVAAVVAFSDFVATDVPLVLDTNDSAFAAIDVAGITPLTTLD